MFVAIDFETHLIGPGAIFPKPVCLSFYVGTCAAIHKGSDMEPFLDSLLTSNKNIIAHNAVFECCVIYYHFPSLRVKLLDALDAGRIICTKINEQLHNTTVQKPINKFSLADLILKYFNKDIFDKKKGEDSWRLRYSELEDIDLKDWPQEAIDYSIEDSIWAYKVYMSQSKVDYILSVRSAVYLNLMASKGISIDENRVRLLKEEILLHLKPHYDFLIEQGFCSQFGNKVKKQIKRLKEYIVTLNIETRQTKKGALSVDGESLEFYYQQIPDKVIKAFQNIAEYEKVLTSYISRFTSDIIYTQYNPVVSTGRTSSSGSNLFPSLNIQQMPREVPNVSYDVRNCFIPSTGMKIVSIDYAGLELASTAHQLKVVYGRSGMADILNAGDSPTDLHSALAARVKGCSYEEFVAKKKEPGYKEMRQLAKPINLGFPGGIGYDTMRHLLWISGVKTRFDILHKENYKNNLYYYRTQLNHPELRIARTGKYEWALVRDELVGLKRAMFDLYPELELFLKETHLRYLTGEHRMILNEYGEWDKEPMYRYEIDGFVHDWCTYTAFCNGFLMQSPSAIGAKKALSKVIRTFLDNPDIRPLAFIHDELLFEVKESRTDLIDEAANIMISEMQSILPSVRISVEASMSDYWQKADGFWTKQYFQNARC